MTIDLSQITFVNDFYSATLEDGSTLYINRIDESLESNNETTDIHGYNIAIVSYDETEYTECSNIIGMGNNLITLTTDHAEQYEGKELSDDNIAYCKLETVNYDDE